jgi:hypothetical protein
MERDPSLREDLAFEDVVVGEVWRTPAHQVSDKDISDFAAVTHDHHPLHVAIRHGPHAKGRTTMGGEKKAIVTLGFCNGYQRRG